MIEHCVSAFCDKQRRDLYQNYISDIIQNIGANIAKSVQGEYYPHRFSELIQKKKEPEETPEEIKNRIKDKVNKGG